MSANRNRQRLAIYYGLVLTAACAALWPAGISQADEPAAPKRNWLKATAYAVPKETAPEGEGYFAIVPGLDGRLYIGTHANAVNSWLVEFDPKTKQMKAVVDCHKAIGKDLRGFGAQSKIHTRNNVGASGKIYFGTKQGYPDKTEKREDYPGGYPMVYDPKTGETKVYPIPVPHQGINSITPDEARGVAYISTCADHRPGPGENAVFLILDLATGKYRELMDTEHFYGFIVVDYLGRAYHPILGGDIARFDPRAGKLERLKQTIDGQSPTDETRLALAKPDPINWDISPDGKTLYAVAMSGNALFSYDLTAEGSILPGKTVGTLVAGATKTDCRAMCVGKSGTCWVAVTEKAPEGIQLLHLVSYRPGEKAPTDHGPVSIANPDYTPMTDSAGKNLPFHGGTITLKDGTVTPRHVNLGVAEGNDGNVYSLMLIPYTLLQIPNPRGK
jgi:hypothetical protein